MTTDNAGVVATNQGISAEALEKAIDTLASIVGEMRGLPLESMLTAVRGMKGASRSVIAIAEVRKLVEQQHGCVESMIAAAIEMRQAQSMRCSPQMLLQMAELFLGEKVTGPPAG